MPERLLSQQDIEERLSQRYVEAVAARGGFTTSLPDLDRNGIDLQIEAGGPRRPKLDIQLKATINLGQPRNGSYAYPLDVKNYAQLIDATMVPRILVVLDLPQDPGQWLDVTPDRLLLRRCAYWCSLVGEQETDNKESITVHLRQEQAFTVAALNDLMDRAATGSL